MAGDWIPMVHGLADSTEVVKIASLTRPKPRRKHTPNTYETVGALHRVWCIADAQTDDGILDGYTPELLDSQVGIEGFARAMADVGWLIIMPQSLVVPHFSEHLGRSAKRRLRDAKRARQDRGKDDGQGEPVTESHASEAGISRTGSGQNPNPPRDNRTTTEQVHSSTCASNNNSAQPDGPASVVVSQLCELGYDRQAAEAIAKHPNCTTTQVLTAVAIADDNERRGIEIDRLAFIRDGIERGWQLTKEAVAANSKATERDRELARLKARNAAQEADGGRYQIALKYCEALPPDELKAADEAVRATWDNGKRWMMKDRGALDIVHDIYQRHLDKTGATP